MKLIKLLVGLLGLGTLAHGQTLLLPSKTFVGDGLTLTSGVLSVSTTQPNPMTFTGNVTVANLITGGNVTLTGVGNLTIGSSSGIKRGDAVTYPLLAKFGFDTTDFFALYAAGNNNGGSPQIYIRPTYTQFTATTDATTATGAITCAGGVLIQKKLALSTYADGSLSVASGIVTSSSDARLKNIKGAFARGLSDVERLHPMSYTWRPISGIVSDQVYSGFIAQDVKQAIPEAVTRPDSRGYYGVQDRPITAALVNAVKELAGRPGTFEIRAFEIVAALGLMLGIRANWKKS